MDDDKTQRIAVLDRGTQVSHYTIVSRIGAGGMGEVYLAEDTSLNRQVALKFLSPHLCQDADCRARFKREAQSAAKLDHPNIVTVYEVGEFQGRPFFAMQFVEGQSLRDLIGAAEVSVERAVDLGVQICDGLRAAHEHGITHRDIKPSNILIDAHGRVRIVDFGLASVVGADYLTKAGSRLGTMGYMSPEQVCGKKVDQRTDLFASGVILYELITGRNPFVADNEATSQHLLLSQTPEPLARYRSGVTDALQAIVNRALEKDPETRYQSAADMMADLRRLRRRSSDPGGASYTGRLPARARWLRLRLTLSVITIFALAVIFLQVYRQDTKETTPVLNHLAVIPFANLTDLSISQAFCDGLMETLTSKLSQLAEFEGGLLIVPASEVRFNKIRSAGQAHLTFGVNLAITGSIQQYGDGIRAILNLVDAVNERQLNGRMIYENREDLSLLQDTSVVEVAQMLNIQLRPESRRILDAGGTRLSEAYSAYLEGRGFLQSYHNLASLDSARSHFESAIKLDSNYALAYAGLGEVYWRKYNLTNDVSWVEPGISYSSRALELNDQLAPVLVTLGLVHSETGQFQEAVSYLKRALQIDSTNTEAFVQLASAYESLGRSAEAESTFQRSIRLRPNLWRSHYAFARFYAFRGRNKDALNQLAIAESLAPVGAFPYGLLGSLCAFLGDSEKAKELLKRSLSIEPNYLSYSNLGAIYQSEEEYQESAAMYRKAIELNDVDFRPWINLAIVSKKLPNGEEQAMAAYARAIALAEQNREINPNDAELISYLADCYWKTGHREQSLTLADQAAQLAPDNVEVMVRVGIVFEQAGRHKEALQLVGTAAQRGFSIDRIRATEELQNLISDPRFDSLLTVSR